MGGRNGNGNYNGSLDEVMLFNRNISEAEALQLYYGGLYGGDVMGSSQTSVGDNIILIIGL